MISMAPTPLYLPAEEANRVICSPIFQRKDAKYKDSSKQQQSEQKQQQEKPKSTTGSNKSLKRSGSTWLSNQIDKRQIELMELSGKSLSGSNPRKCQEGVGGGVYFIQGDKDTHPVSVFKPIDEENGIVGPNHSLVGMKAGTLPGEGVFKEVAVYLFDQMNNQFFGVPVTTLVEVQHPIWSNNKDNNSIASAASESSSSSESNGTAESSIKTQEMVKKIGSLQEYIVYEDTADEVGCSKFSVPDIHRIGLLDCLVLNCDRHSGNLLVVAKEDGATSLELVPIDHSLCLPSSDQLSDAWFDWINFPQSKVPFTNEVKQMIQSMDIDEIIISLHAKLPKLRTECLETLKLTTLFVKKAVEYGLNLNQIGTLISRYQSLDEPSVFENLVSNTTLKSKNLKISLSNQSFWVYYQQEIDSFFKSNY